MGKRLYVGSLPFTITEDEVNDLFGQQGKVVSTKLIRDRATGQSRGFAFVEMESDEDAANAITKLNGSPIGDRKMTVSEARPQEERGFGGGGGGRGGYGGGGGGFGGRRGGFHGGRGGGGGRGGSGGRSGGGGCRW